MLLLEVCYNAPDTISSQPQERATSSNSADRRGGGAKSGISGILQAFRLKLPNGWRLATPWGTGSKDESRQPASSRPAVPFAQTS